MTSWVPTRPTDPAGAVRLDVLAKRLASRAKSQAAPAVLSDPHGAGAALGLWGAAGRG